jgi:hypothetical protein
MINDETKQVKQALKKAGYPVKSCSHGRGTAYCWIAITIDDYEKKIINGKMIDQYAPIKKIAYEITKDDNQCVHFLKYHRCEECLISNCTKYHTPDMHVCGNFVNKEISDRLNKEHEDYLKEQEEIKKNPIGFTLYEDGETIELKNRVVNCGAYFTINRNRFDALILSGKTREYIFDLLASEDTDRKRAEQYKKECESNREKIGHPWIYDGKGNRDNTVGSLPDAMIRDQKPNEIKEIVIVRAEGPSSLCGKPKYFDSFITANNYLSSQSYSFPKTGGYDKHDFKITFIDGQTYDGRLDCKHHLCTDNDLNLYDHIVTFCKFYSGRMEYLPEHLTKEDYDRLLTKQGNDTIKAYGDLLDIYILPNQVI